MKIRPAAPSDLRACQRLLQANGLDSGETAPTPHLRHVLEQGRVLVAEDGGATVGFAAAVDRGPRTFLTDCFVDPERLGQGVGRRLLDALLDRDRLLDTFASDDPRALPLYARFGMRPLAPLLWLRVESDRVAPLPETVELEPVAPDDAELVALDADIVRAPRPAEHALWSQGGAIPHVVRRGGRAAVLRLDRAVHERLAPRHLGGRPDRRPQRGRRRRRHAGRRRPGVPHGRRRRDPRCSAPTRRYCRCSRPACGWSTGTRGWPRRRTSTPPATCRRWLHG